MLLWIHLLCWEFGGWMGLEGFCGLLFCVAGRLVIRVGLVSSILLSDYSILLSAYSILLLACFILLSDYSILLLACFISLATYSHVPFIHLILNH